MFRMLWIVATCLAFAVPFSLAQDDAAVDPITDYFAFRDSLLRDCDSQTISRVNQEMIREITGEDLTRAIRVMNNREVWTFVDMGNVVSDTNLFTFLFNTRSALCREAADALFDIWRLEDAMTRAARLTQAFADQGANVPWQTAVDGAMVLWFHMLEKYDAARNLGEDSRVQVASVLNDRAVQEMLQPFLDIDQLRREFGISGE